MLANRLNWNIRAALAVYLLASASALAVTLPQYPTFSTPTTVTTVNLYGTSTSFDDMLAITTFEGAYNQQQGTNRLFVALYPQDPFWLTQSAPSTVTVSNLSFTGTDPDGALKAILAAYGPQGTNAISKYIVCDPVSNPESCNMATTMAGINDAIAVNPDNLSLMSTYGLTQLTNGDLRTYLWVGSDANLVGNTNINLITTPGGGSGGGTTGWLTNSCSGNTLGTATFLGVTNTIEWTSPANVGTICAALSEPDSGNLATVPGYYTFSVQVAGSGNVFLDAWDGEGDYQSSTVTLNSTGWQTLQVTIPIPASNNTNPVKLEVRANTTNNAVTCYFINAATVESAVAVDEYQYQNLINSTTSLGMATITLDSYDLRDYIVASKMLAIYIGTGTAEKPIFSNILNHYASNTPVLGYVVGETADIAFLSGQPYNRWQNVSERVRNGSVYASFPGPSSLSQPSPAGIKAQNGYIYVGTFLSDGDNIDFLETQNWQKFTQDPYLGAVPLGWTASPASFYFMPGFLDYYYAFLPQSSEMMAGPSGFGYQTATTGNEISTFAGYTSTAMSALSMTTVNAWMDLTPAPPPTPDLPGDVVTLATDINKAHTLWVYPFSSSYSGTYNYAQLSDTAGTVVDGQVIGYASQASQVISRIQSYVSANCSSSAPCFVPTQLINAYMRPSDLLYIAEQLELNKVSGQEYVFLTPAELALTEANYYNSGSISATSNAQATPGATLLKEFPNETILNSNGQNESSPITGLFSMVTPYANNVDLMYMNYQGTTRYYQPSGGRVQRMRTHGTTTADTVAQASLQSIPISGGFYNFKVQVAGSGTAKISVYNGSTWTTSSTVTLTSSWQTLSVISSAPSSGGLFQVIIPAQSSSVTLYFSNATSAPNNWAMIGVIAGTTEDLQPATYNYTPALNFTLSNTQGHTQEIYEYPVVKANTSYVWSADVAGTGSAYVQANDGSKLCSSSTVTLSSVYQTVSCTASTLSSGSPDFFVITPQSSSAQNVYIRNASVIATSSLGTVDFNTGVESGQTQLTWTNTVDNTPPGGEEKNVTSAVLQLTTSEMSHGGSNAIQYGGTATNGTSVFAYMKAFSSTAVITSTTRLSYWVFPQSPKGAEPNASTTTGLNSTCVAIDMVLTNGSNTRDLRDSGVTDQYGNQLHPAHMCGHLQPDVWNYVTSDLSSLAGWTINRIDIGYDQPNAPSGNYRGYVDDINIHH